MAPPRRAIVSVTSAHAPLHHGHETGLFVGETLHPFNVSKKAGFDVDLVSTTGTYVPDRLSLQPTFLSVDNRKQWEDTNREFRQKPDDRLKPRAVDPSKYGISFASAGHAALIDYPYAKGLQDIAIDVWVRGGIVSSVQSPIPLVSQLLAITVFTGTHAHAAATDRQSSLASLIRPPTNPSFMARPSQASPRWARLSWRS